MNGSVELLNATSYHELHIFYDKLYENLPAKIAYLFLVFFACFVGPTLIYGIVLFEGKDGDPQKRNVINRLFSVALINEILFSLLLGSCKVWRMLFGLISSDVMIWIEGFGYIFINNFILFINEITIFRYLHIIVWKRVRGLDDRFWAFFLSAATIGWSCWQCVIEHTPLEVRMHVFKMSMDILPGSKEGKR